MKNYYFGIDVGGTFIKAAIVDSHGNVLTKDKAPTEHSHGPHRIVENIKALCDRLLSVSGIKQNEICGAGIGIPGMVDSVRGRVISACNLGLSDFDIGDRAREALGVPIAVCNDASAAALGEMRFGFGGIYKNIVLLTLGTGVGGGVVIDGKLFEGRMGAGAELGHTVIKTDGEPCTCGRRGCLEAYASASAIIRDTRRAMQENKASRLWELGSLDKVDGKSAFDFYKTDADAKAVVDSYIEKLGVGITNMANIFRPEAVIIGGGMSNQGDELIIPLQKYLDKHVFASEFGPSVKVLRAKLGNDAGTLGAAGLLME